MTTWEGPARDQQYINIKILGGNDYGEPDWKFEGLYDRDLPPRIRYPQRNDDPGDL